MKPSGVRQSMTLDRGLSGLLRGEVNGYDNLHSFRRIKRSARAGAITQLAAS